MKSKITFLLTSLLMLLLGVGSSYAEVGDIVSDISQISPTKCYTITTAVRGALVANNAGTQGVSTITHGAVNENASTDADAAKWGILLHDGSYHLYNVKTRTVYGQGGVLVGYLNNGLELKALDSPDGDYKFKFVQGTNTLNNDQTGVFVLNSWNTEDAGNKLLITEAGDFEAPSLENISSVTFNYQNENGVTVETETIENCISGATINSTRTGLWGVTINTPSTVATGEDQTINTGYTLAEGYPLKFGTTLLDAPKYLWKINRNPAKYASANDDLQISNTAGRSALDEAHAFCFVGSPLGFLIYNVGSDSPYGPGAGDEVLTMGEELNAATFVFVKNEDNGQNLLRDINNANGYLNDTGGKMGYWLSSWAFSDAGSSFSFIEWPTQFEVDGLKYVVKGEYSNEVYVTYNADAEPTAAGQNAYTGDIVVPATVTYEGAVFNVTEIGRKAFAHSTVTSIVIGDNVTTTGMDACANIPTLKSLTIGSGVTTVSQGICYSCTNLKEVTLKPTTAPAGAPYMFTSNPKMHVKASALQSFLNADQWKSYANNYVAETDGYQFDHNEMLAVATLYESYIAQCDGKFSNNVGCYSEATKNATEAKIAEAKALAEDASIETTTAIVKAMASVWAPIPIVEGYYYVLSAGKGPGYYTGGNPGDIHDDEDRYALYNANGLVNWKSFNMAPEQIYYLSPDSEKEGNWFVKNLADNTYINKGTKSYACDIITSVEAQTSQIIEPTYAAGKFTIKYDGNANVYSLTSSHNGADGNTEGKLNIWGSASEAAKYKMNVFSLRPVSEEKVLQAKEKLAEGLEDLITKVESDEIEGSDLPGYYATANVSALNAALEVAKGAVDSSADARYDAFMNLKSAYNTAITEFTPITEGYYYLVNKYAAYEDKFGAPAAMFTAPLDVRESGLSNVRFDTFDENNANYIFKITPKEGVAGGFYVQNAYNNYYLNTGDGNTWYGEETTCTETAVNAQLFTNYGVGQFFIADETDNQVSRCVRTTGAKNGTIYGWTTTGDNVPENQTGYNAWELVPVAADKVAELIAAQTTSDAAASEAYTTLDTYVGEIQETYDSYVESEKLNEDLKQNLAKAYKDYTDAKAARNYDINALASKYNDIKSALEAAMEAAEDILNEDKVTPNYYIVAEEPSTPEPGKTYVVKNAYNNLYLTDKGIAAKYSRLNNTALWSLEATDQTVDEELPVYLLKSEKLGGFWQYDDFATLSGNGGLLDGYDVYNYAGLNATIGDAATAQGFTVLPATAYANPSTRSSVANGQEPLGFVLAAAAPVEHNGSSSLFKLDTQRNTDAGLTPYDATVGWLFYEATLGTDWNEEIALAKTEYALATEDMPTGTTPGLYDAEKISAYNAAVEAIEALNDASTKVEMRKAIDNFAATYAEALAVNPIVEGYYYVLSAGKGPGYYTGENPGDIHDDEGRYALYNANGLVSWKSFSPTAPEQIYYLSPDSEKEGNWFVKNLADNTYINKGTAQYTCDVITSVAAETSQIIEPTYAAGKFTIRYDGNPYIYSLTRGHNGANGTVEGNISIWGTAAEAAKYKMNVFSLRPVSEERVQQAKEKLSAGLEDLIAKIEGEEIEGSDLPGYYVEANVNALNTAVEAAKGVEEGSADDRFEALLNLKSAYNTAITEFTPITEGYYYLVSKYAAYKEANDGKPAAMFTAPLDVRESGLSNVRFDTFDENNANYIFKITPKEGVDGGFYVQNAYNNYYLNTGDGNTWYGEVTTCTETAVNAQLFTNYGVGQFFIADETDNRVSRCVRTTGVKNGTIYGWTTTGDNIPENQTGYNAWELVPVSADKVAELIAAQTESDNTVGEAYTVLETYVGEIQETYDSYVENTELSEELKTALTEAYKDYTDAKAARNYDILALAPKYSAIKAALEEALKAAHDEINGINGIAAGGNAAVTVGNGGITVTASEATTIKVVATSGAVVAVRNLKAGETATISLLPGVYVVNGNKVMVK